MTNEDAIKMLNKLTIIRRKAFLESLADTNIEFINETVALGTAIKALERTTKKGKWVNGFCSICGEPIPTDSARDALFIEDNKFCYNCGADMRDK